MDYWISRIPVDEHGSGGPGGALSRGSPAGSVIDSRSLVFVGLLHLFMGRIQPG